MSGAAENGEAREVRYAPAWDREAVEGEFQKRGRIGWWIVIALTMILLAGLWGGVYRNHQLQDGWNGWLLGTALLMTAGVIAFLWILSWFGPRQFQKIVERGGWGVLDLTPFFFAKGLLLISFSVIVVVILGRAYLLVGTLEGAPFHYLWWALVCLLFGLGLIITSWYLPREAGRRFDLPLDDVIALLKADADRRLPGFAWRTDRRGRPLLADGSVRIVPRRDDDDCTGVVVRTPRDQLAHNRELREGVSAILEGRPWPPDPRARDETRPEEGV